MKINAPQTGWAEQEPEMWWKNIKTLIKQIVTESEIDGKLIKYIGIAYQMHGLVLVDKDGKVLRPSIIWCDSRAVETGQKALAALGDGILPHLLNSPGNFTASKLKWVKENEPGIYAKAYKFMLPGDYIAYRFTGNIQTTMSGLSEGIFWDFQKNEVYKPLLNYYNINKSLIPETTETFADQGKVSTEIASELGICKDAIVSYRAGDQPNNALSLNVFNSGEVAATAGTSGVVYGISNEIKYDPKSRVNTFAHVNHSKNQTRLGVLLNINGTGILNSWMQKNTASDLSYNEMNQLASNAEEGSNGLLVFPFGNGAERMLENHSPGASIHKLNLNTHNRAHLIRASQEAVAFSFNYGMEIMKAFGINTSVIRAAYGNMFLSEVFSQTLSNISGTAIYLYDTDGSQGAARAAALGAGFYGSTEEAFSGIKHIKTIEPKPNEAINQAYGKWVDILKNDILTDHE